MHHDIYLLVNFLSLSSMHTVIVTPTTLLCRKVAEQMNQLKEKKRKEKKKVKSQGPMEKENNSNGKFVKLLKLGGHSNLSKYQGSLPQGFVIIN